MACIWTARFVLSVAIGAVWLLARPVPLIAQNQTPACTAAPQAIDEDSVTVTFVDRVNAIVTWDPPAASQCLNYGYQLAATRWQAPPSQFQFSTASPSVSVAWTDFEPRWVQLRATNPIGSGPVTALVGPFRRLPCSERPPPPEGVIATGASSIEWTPIAIEGCIVTYVVGVGANASQPTSSIFWTAPTTEAKQTLSLPPALHPWYARVHALTAMGWSDASAAVEFNPAAPPIVSAPYPATPTNIRVTVTGRTLTVAWDLVEEVDSVWLVALPSETSNEKIAEALVPPSTSFTYTFDAPFSFWLRVSPVRGAWIGAAAPRVRVEIP